jgi:integrase
LRHFLHLRDDAGKELVQIQSSSDDRPHALQPNKLPPTAIAAANSSLLNRGVRLSLEQRGQTLGIRGTWTNLDGQRRQQRLKIDCPATPGGLLEAEKIAIHIYGCIQQGLDPKAELEAERKKQIDAVTKDRLTVAEGVATYEHDYWSKRDRSHQTINTWKGYLRTMLKVPQQGPLTVDFLLQAIVANTKPQTDTRFRACVHYAKVLELCELPGAIKLKNLQKKPKPGPRAIPSDDAIIKLVDAVRGERYGWCIAAMATFGCRTGEVPSLQLNDDGTASCLTIKTKLSLPEERTCFAYPEEWIERWDLHNVDIPGGVRWLSPQSWDAKRSENWVAAWRQWRCRSVFKAISDELTPGFDLYNLRHRWAMRSIEANINQSLCAQAMGHTLKEHEQTYHRELKGNTLRAAMARLAEAS